MIYIQTAITIVVIIFLVLTTWSEEKTLDKNKNIINRVKYAKYAVRQAMRAVIEIDPEERSKYMELLDGAEEKILELERKVNKNFIVDAVVDEIEK